MAIQWLRLWHDMPNDPKWRTIARISGQPISLVKSTYLHLLVDASRNVTRGHATVTPEDLASALDVTEPDIQAVLDAMQSRVLDGMTLLGWETRQPKREDSGDENTGVKSAAQRKAEQRERERITKELADVTKGHEASREVTLDKDKEKEKEKEHIQPLPASADDAEDVRKCPVGTLVDLYHELMPNNPRVKVLSDARKSAIRARWKEAAKFDFPPFGYKTKSEGIAKWRVFFEVCAESDFLTGLVKPLPGHKLFMADIDFIFSPAGFAKTLENKYHRGAA